MDEDEAAARPVEFSWITAADPKTMTFGDRFNARRAIREVAVKRQIIALCESETDETGGKPLAVRILHLMASIYESGEGEQR